MSEWNWENDAQTSPQAPQQPPPQQAPQQQYQAPQAPQYQPPPEQQAPQYQPPVAEQQYTGKDDWKNKKPQKEFVIRIPLGVAMNIEDDIPPASLAAMIDMAKFLHSKGFIIRYPKHKLALSVPLEQAVPATSLASFIPFSGFSATKGGEPVGKADHFINKKVIAVLDLAIPNIAKLKNGVKAIIGVVAGLLYGAFTNEPVSLYICYTPDGITDIANRSKETGYGSTGIELANKAGIFVVNVGSETFKEDFGIFLSRLKGG